MSPNIRRKRDGGGAWYAEAGRRDFTHPLGGNFDRFVFIGCGSDIVGRGDERADDKLHHRY